MSTPLDSEPIPNGLEPHRFISYALAKVLAGRASELNSASVAVALAFLPRFAPM